MDFDNHLSSDVLGHSLTACPQAPEHINSVKAWGPLQGAFVGTNACRQSPSSSTNRYLTTELVKRHLQLLMLHYLSLTRRWRRSMNVAPPQTGAVGIFPLQAVRRPKVALVLQAANYHTRCSGSIASSFLLRTTGMEKINNLTVSSLRRVMGFYHFEKGELLKRFTLPAL